MFAHETWPPLTFAQESCLLAELRAGAPEAQSKVVRRFQGGLYREALRIVGDPALAEDVVQDTWMAVLSRLHRFERRSSLRTWITGIAINRARDCRRKTFRLNHVAPLTVQEEVDTLAMEPASGSGSAPVAESDPEALVLEKEQRHALSAAVQALPTTQRSVVTLELRGYEPAQTREALQITDLARRVRLSRARSRLRRDLVRFAA